MNYLLSIITLLTLGLFTPTLTDVPTSAKDIMAKNKELTESGDQEVAFTLDLINKKGKKRRQESIWTYLTDESDVRYSLFRFHAPSDVKGTGEFLPTKKRTVLWALILPMKIWSVST